jgi:hypothetical protein
MFPSSRAIGLGKPRWEKWRINTRRRKQEAKTFDSINWPYLLEVMKFLGFGPRWCNWISSLWLTASSSYLLNGESGRKILHCRGVRQGDPLSPMLFLLAMEPLHKLCQKAEQFGLLSRVSKGCENFRASFYADDATVFIKPSNQDLQVIKFILKIFSEVSGLTINMDKTQFYPIRCASAYLTFLSQQNHPISQFPISHASIWVSLCTLKSYQEMPS